MNRGCMREELSYANTQAVPENLDANRQKDESGEPGHDTGPGSAQHPHQSRRISVTDCHQHTDNGHTRRHRKEVARITMLQTWAGLVSQVRTESDCN